MRYATALLCCAAALALSACVTEPDNGSPKVQTTAEADRSGVKGVAESPLRDLNVLRTKIPEVLLHAMADPYERPGLGRCADLVERLKPLNEALGEDLDVTSKEGEQGMMAKGKTTALTVASGAASDVIPFRGWIRKLSGAEQHDRYVQAAITAGAVRRAYLKGLGEAKGCDPPATPSHELAGTPIIDQTMKPKYPIH
ncbi:MAG TPA: hypothetical protein VFE18_09115 [Phenylobacterium sp.]|jgi:hypothetical protein|uniref:hypothetical protein n=1 Tax=Phenylobacterium sp. TaxID=1871053 RepID=UPI002D6F171F|nr:hypothetical protein [Phenylobacterium sp.]HZZ68320.1 hypothetical protein [Phenylobacterium sp.]